MSKRYPKLIVEDMLQAVEELQSFTEGMTYEQFVQDVKSFRAVLASTMILGEAVRILDEDTMAKAPEIPWHKLRGMRNRLIHEYFDVDSHILWQVATVEAPALAKHLRKLLGSVII
jgi:uncharacterized protein with HEPN domain